MNMKSAIRKVEGLLGINFFTGGADTSVQIMRNDEANQNRNTQNPSLSDTLARQIFHADIEPEPIITTFDHRGANNQVGVRLDGRTKLVDASSNIGWIGDRISGSNGAFQVGRPQVIDAKYLTPRRLGKLVLCGVRRDNGQNSFPTVFNIRVFREDETEVFKNGTNNPLIRFTATNQNQQVELEWNFEDEEYVAEFEHLRRGVIRVRLEIFQWSGRNELPRITYFSGEMHESFDGSNLQSLEILEEKTGTVDRLSYGLSYLICRAVLDLQI